jgi:hypothetical protein
MPDVNTPIDEAAKDGGPKVVRRGSDYARAKWKPAPCGPTISGLTRTRGIRSISSRRIMRSSGMLDPLFPLYSDGSHGYHMFLEAGELGLLTDEVRRTIAELDRTAAARVGKGQSTAGEALELARPWAAILEDLAEGPRNIAGHTGILAEFQVNPNNGVRWEAKVAALRKEIEARRSGYAALVAKGQLTGGQAKQQLERLEAVHDLYWHQGFAFDGARDELRAIGDAILEQETSGHSSRAERPAATSREDGGATPPARSTAGATQ